jgi:hypothetical protein
MRRRKNAEWKRKTEHNLADDIVDKILFKMGKVVHGPDQTAWAAEAEAVLVVLRAAFKVGINVHFIIDNWSVCQALDDLTAMRLRCPEYAFGIWSEADDLLVGRAHTCIWVPSHNKRRGTWTPTDNQRSGGGYRMLNHVADEQATEALKEPMELRKALEGQITLAKAWAQRALSLLADAAQTWNADMEALVRARPKGAQALCHFAQVNETGT